MAWNQLCAEAALLITWLAIHRLQGWLDGERRVRWELQTFQAEEQLERFRKRRAELRLDSADPRFVAKRREYERRRTRRSPGQDPS